MLITAFDPASTRNIGWANFVLTEDKDKINITEWQGGTFVLPTTEENWQVLWPMFMLVEAFLMKFKPDLVILEKTSSFAGGFITGQVSNCMGVLLSVCGKLDMEVEFVYPTSVKKVVAGHGRATKSQIKKAVRSKLENIGIVKPVFDSDHTADATASLFYWFTKNISEGQ